MILKPIAPCGAISLASLISFKLYIRTEGAKPLRYLGIFTLANVIGLAVLGVVAWLLP